MNTPTVEITRSASLTRLAQTRGEQVGDLRAVAAGYHWPALADREVVTILIKQEMPQITAGNQTRSHAAQLFQMGELSEAM